MRPLPQLKEQNTGVCLTVNPARPGGAYGYVDMGDWVGGQAECVLVPYADFNLLKLPDRDAAMEKIRDLTCLSDILPTGYHGAVTAGVGPGSTVYVAGAGPVGLAAAASARLLRPGDEIIVNRTLYGCTFALLHHGIGEFGVVVKHGERRTHPHPAGSERGTVRG